METIFIDADVKDEKEKKEKERKMARTGVLVTTAALVNYITRFCKYSRMVFHCVSFYLFCTGNYWDVGHCRRCIFTSKWIRKLHLQVKTGIWRNHLLQHFVQVRRRLWSTSFCEAESQRGPERSAAGDQLLCGQKEVSAASAGWSTHKGSVLQPLQPFVVQWSAASSTNRPFHGCYCLTTPTTRMR